MHRFIFWQLFCCAFIFSDTAFSQTTPPYYGVYALRDGQLTELKESSGGENILKGNRTIQSPSNIKFPDGKIQFVFYRRELTQSAPDKVLVQIVARLARELQQSSYLDQGFDKPVNAWYVRERGYEFRVAPFGDNKEMVVVRSATPNFALPDGRYAISFGGKLYDFLINKDNTTDPDHCVNQVSQGSQPPNFPTCESTVEAACRPADQLARRIAPLARGQVASFTMAAIPRSFRELGLRDESGKDKKLADWRGRTVLLYTWATWCVPCRNEMPILDAFGAKLGGSGFDIVAVDVQPRDPAKSKAWLGEVGAKRLSYFSDPDSKLFKSLHDAGKMRGLPTSLLLDGAGCELATHPGPVPWTSDDAIKLVRAAIDGGR